MTLMSFFVKSTFVSNLCNSIGTISTVKINQSKYNLYTKWRFLMTPLQSIKIEIYKVTDAYNLKCTISGHVSSNICKDILMFTETTKTAFKTLYKEQEAIRAES